MNVRSVVMFATLKRLLPSWRSRALLPPSIAIALLSAAATWTWPATLNASASRPRVRDILPSGSDIVTIHICNSGNTALSVAVVTNAGQDRWGSPDWFASGWWKIEPGHCKDLNRKGLPGRYDYYFAFALTGKNGKGSVRYALKEESKGLFRKTSSFKNVDKNFCVDTAHGFAVEGELATFEDPDKCPHGWALVPFTVGISVTRIVQVEPVSDVYHYKLTVNADRAAEVEPFKPKTKTAMEIAAEKAAKEAAARKAAVDTKKTAAVNNLDLSKLGSQGMASWVIQQHGELELTDAETESISSNVFSIDRSGRYYPTPTQMADYFILWFGPSGPVDVEALRASIIAYESLEVTEEDIDAEIEDRRNRGILVSENSQFDRDIAEGFVRNKRFRVQFPDGTHPSNFVGLRYNFDKLNVRAGAITENMLAEIAR